MERQRIVKTYQKAFLLWKQKRYTEAGRVIEQFWQLNGTKSLRGMLLMAYILRDQQKYVSEVKVLEALFEHFRDSGEVKLLADAWSMMGDALRCLGEGKLSVEAFKKAVEVEPALEQKLVECSNAIFSANAIAGVTADYMQSLYVLYRELLGNLSVRLYSPAVWKHKKFVTIHQ